MERESWNRSVYDYDYVWVWDKRVKMTGARLVAAALSFGSVESVG